MVIGLRGGPAVGDTHGTNGRGSEKWIVEREFDRLAAAQIVESLGARDNVGRKEHFAPGVIPENSIAAVVVFRNRSRAGQRRGWRKVNQLNNLSRKQGAFLSNCGAAHAAHRIA
jgi:hypothetical protein